LMLLDTHRMTSSQLTYGTIAFQASWLPDSSAIFFTNVTTKGSAVVQMAPREGAPQSTVVPRGKAVVVNPDSPDGRSLIYARIGLDGNGDLYFRSLEKPDEERSFLATPAYEGAPRLSPDGAWIAYQSNETGSPEIFVRSFPDGGEKTQISRGGAFRPVWRRDGKEVFYLSPDCDLMAVPITLKPSLLAGTPEKLFRTSIDPGGASTYTQFDVHPDNQRFIMVVPVTDAPQPVNVILNWQSLLKKQ
jgi:eukaryotic-like serine/threonine-protein kinase